MGNRSLVLVLLLLFGPAAITVASRPVGMASAAVSVVILVWLVLRNERRGTAKRRDGSDSGPVDLPERQA